MITVLQTTDGKNLTKTFRFDGHDIIKTAYDKAFRFNAVHYPVENIDELSEILTGLEHEPNCCVIRGRIVGADTTLNVRRLLHPVDDDPAAFEERPQGCPWLLVDFDGVPNPNWLPEDLRLAYLVDLLPEWFHGASYHYRWSASAGMDDWQTLSCHLWFWLDQPWRSEVIRERIDVEGWECDPSPFDAVHVHYTARPIFEGMDDPLQGRRSGLIRGDRDTVTLPAFVRPVQPVYPRMVKPLSANGFENKFEEMLGRIGPNFHIPIRDAIFFYAKNAPSVDQWELKQRLTDAIIMAPSGRSPKRNYDSSYLDRSISGALRK